MAYRYTPFEKELSEISPDDLATLKDVYEGWYVDYKSELIEPRKIAKSLSSFANQLGGWIFFGVLEDGNLHVAESFPGIPHSDVPSALESIRNASKDLISPDVFYNSRVFTGPIASLELPADRSIIVIQIPQGADCPYVHNDGRIYRRIADSSDPKPETDRARFDLLIERGDQARSRLADLVTQIPTVSEAEKDQCYIHLSITSDPYETLGHRYSAEFSEFSELMRQDNLPFDNIYSKSGGYIARQTMNYDPYYRVFTWEFSRHCHSFITIPVPLLQSGVFDPDRPAASIYEPFNSKIIEKKLKTSRILNLNFTFVTLWAIIRRHRRLVWQANVKGPFYVKAYLENIWRTVPFIDLPAFLDHISEYGFPIVQDTDVLVPNGTSLDTFIVLPECDVPKSETTISAQEAFDQIIDVAEIGRYILEAFGIPSNFIEHLNDLIVRHIDWKIDS